MSLGYLCSNERVTNPKEHRRGVGGGRGAATADNAILVPVLSHTKQLVLNTVIVQVSSVYLFSQNIIQFRNIYNNCKLARKPRRNQKAYETWAPQSKKFASDTLQIGTRQRLS